MKYQVILLATLLFFLSCDKDTPESPTPVPVSLVTAEGNPRTWTWIPKETMYARDGSTTGYIANLETNSTKLLIYLQGGGACFNSLTCGGNPNSFGEADAETVISVTTNALLFNRGFSINPFVDWNYIFVPYSTGDVHSGTNSSANVVGGPSDQKMTGYDNYTVVIEELKTYFQANQGITDIILAGGSAGSFGTFLNFIQTADAFGSNINITLLADSGILLMDDSLFDDCLDTKWTDLWDFVLPADLNTVVTGNYDYDMQKIYEYHANKYPNANFGMISSYGDQVMRFFWGFGQNNCSGLTGTTTAGQYKDAILDVHDVVDNFDNWKVFFTNGDQHTFLQNDGITYTINGTKLIDWVSDLHGGTAVDLME